MTKLEVLTQILRDTDEAEQFLQELEAKGWTVAPTEPTEDMLNAAVDLYLSRPGVLYYDDSYRAMLSAV